eukprot:gene20506-20422_t
MAKRSYFGTDGIRGRANSHPMTAEVALRVGLAAGKLFRTEADRRHLVVIGKDTRLSGYMIEPALVAGFTSMGMDVRLFGPLPTPGVAMMTRSMRADLGVVISASHNAFSDNGIKLFGPDGYKLSDAREAEIERHMDEGLQEGLVGPTELGRVRRIDDAQARYVEIVKATFPKALNLNGLRVVVDCANGAAYKVAPAVLYELGAEVIEIGVEPNGFNINELCGSTHPATMSAAVKEYRADIGIALDGDADRVTICDETGAVVDGDQIMAIVAGAWAKAEKLSGGGIVATVMSNEIVNRCGPTFASRLKASAAADDAALMVGFEAGRRILGFDTLWEDVEALDGKASAQGQLSLFRALSHVLRSQTYWMARRAKAGESVQALVDRYRPAMAELAALTPAILSSFEQKAVARRAKAF